MYLEEKLNGIKLVLSDRKYLAFFTLLALLFYFLYAKAWNMEAHLKMLAYFPSIEGFLNLLSLIAVSALSSLAVILTLFSLNMKVSGKSKYGFFAIVPSFFISASSCCAPFILTLSSTTIAIGMSIAKFGYAVKTLSFATLLLAILSLSSNISKCCAGGENEAL